MALRLKVAHVSRQANGQVPGASAASIQAFYRNADGTSGTATPLWTAATGGTSSTAARNCNADGTYPYWFPNPGAYNIVETIGGIVMPAIQVAAVAGDIETFTAPTMTNSWVSDATSPVGYTRTSEGMIILRGRATHAGSTAAMFTLPAGYRPATTKRFPIAGSATIQVTVTPAGITSPTASATDVWLDDIRFAEAPP